MNHHNNTRQDDDAGYPEELEGIDWKNIEPEHPAHDGVDG